MASFNLRSSREMQTVFPVHAAFWFCLVGIKPVRCSFGSQTLQQLVSERLHRLQLARGFSQTTLVFAVASDQLFLLTVCLGLWPRKHHLGWLSPEKPSAHITPQHLWDDELPWVTGRDADRQVMGLAGRRPCPQAHRLLGVLHMWCYL